MAPLPAFRSANRWIELLIGPPCSAESARSCLRSHLGEIQIRQLQLCSFAKRPSFSQTQSLIGRRKSPLAGPAEWPAKRAASYTSSAPKLARAGWLAGEAGGRPNEDARMQ